MTEAPTTYCTYRWWGPRVEVADTRVENVCALASEHDGPHSCSCRAVFDPTLEP